MSQVMLCDSVPGHHRINYLQAIHNQFHSVSFRKLWSAEIRISDETRHQDHFAVLYWHAKEIREKSAPIEGAGCILFWKFEFSRQESFPGGHYALLLYAIRSRVRLRVDFNCRRAGALSQRRKWRCYSSELCTRGGVRVGGWERRETLHAVGAVPADLAGI